MDGTPQRPADVPSGAVWIPEAREWRDGAVDERGEKQGVHRSWRADGSLREEVPFVDGKGAGAYRRYHPNGTVAGEGALVDGNLEGTLRSFACDAPTPEALQPCCVPANAWELQTDYHHGEIMARRWYDRQGTQILDSGQPHPERPPSVPAQARYDESSARWVVGSYQVDKGKVAHWRRWTREGVLVEEEDRDDGGRHGVWRRFDGGGALCFEAHYDHGLAHGPFLDRTIVAAEYRDPRAAAEEGRFDAGQAVGVWTLRDAGGALLLERDLGVAVTEDSLARSPAFADPDLDTAGALRRDDAAGLATLSRELRAQRRVGEAIAAMARSVSLTGDAAPLRLLLDQAAWPRAAAAGHDLAVTAIEAEGDRLSALVAAVVRGGEPTALLRAVAAVLRGHRAALQIVDAALLLTPGAPACLVTRALVNVHLGDPDAARADLRSLPDAWDAQRRNLLDYIRVSFPNFGFWPVAIAIETVFEEFPEAPAQSLTSIRSVVQRYATRLAQIRTALARRIGGGGGPRTDGPVPAWLPPVLRELLPDGAVTLGTWTFQQTFDDDADPGDDVGAGQTAASAGAGVVVEEISVDERLALDGASTPVLLGLARREWAALAWLCWSCGLDRIALPDVVAPPARFGPAAGMSIERAWRCRDKLSSGGLVAMSKGVPGFEWEGMHIDAMSPALAEIMTDEHVEVRAMFLWLCDGTAQSPWQSDLRDRD